VIGAAKWEWLLPHSNRLGTRAGVALAVFALAVFLQGFFTIPPIDRDEPRFAQSTRQMLETGDYIDIRFQDSARYKKPVGIYWLQAASVKTWQYFSGSTETRVIWPYRLPSLISAIVSIVLTGAIGAMLFGARAGLFAGILLAIALVMNFEARVAKTDATLLACVLAVQFVLAKAFLGDPDDPPLPMFERLLGWSALGLGLLVKGPVILIFVFGTLLGLVVFKEGLSWVRKLRPYSGAGIALLIALPWIGLITLRSQGAFLNESVAQDLLSKIFDGATTGNIPPGFHLTAFWLGFWPGSLLVMLALPWIWANRADRNIRFCIAWVVPAWIVFEIPLTKLLHYTLPLFPPLAMLASAWLLDCAKLLWHRYWRLFVLGVWSTVSVVLALVVTGLPVIAQEGFSFAALVLGLAVASGLTVHRDLDRQRPARVVASLAFAGVAFQLAVGYIVPNLSRVFLSPRIAAAAQSFTGCADPQYVGAGFDEPSLVFLTETRIRFTDGATAARTMAQADCIIAIIRNRNEQDFLDTSAQLGVAPRMIQRIDGLNIGNTRRMQVTVYAKP